MPQTITLIDTEGAAGPRVLELPASIVGDSFRVPHAAVRDVLGWELKPEGLCRETTCVPIADPSALGDGETLDLEALAGALGRPFAGDASEATAVLGAAAAERAGALASLAAPDFTLPDLSGKLHSLSEHRGEKVLLIVYASW